MKVLAVILAKEESIGVPYKNFREFNGASLFKLALNEISWSVYTPDIAVISSADNSDIDYALSMGSVYPHPKTDSNTTSEDVMIKALGRDKISDYDAVSLVQVTSPFMKTEDFNRCIAQVISGAGSAFTVARFHGYTWRYYPSMGKMFMDGDLKGSPRKPRQSYTEVRYIEAGSVYAMNAKTFVGMERPHRFIDRVEPVEIDPERVFEIDEMWQFRQAKVLNEYQGRLK